MPASQVGLRYEADLSHYVGQTLKAKIIELEPARRRVDVYKRQGQMIEDVQLALKCRRPVHFLGRVGGIVPSPEEVLAKIEKIMAGRCEA